MMSPGRSKDMDVLLDQLSSKLSSESTLNAELQNLNPSLNEVLDALASGLQQVDIEALLRDGFAKPKELTKSKITTKETTPPKVHPGLAAKKTMSATEWNKFVLSLQTREEAKEKKLEEKRLIFQQKEMQNLMDYPELSAQSRMLVKDMPSMEIRHREAAWEKFEKISRQKKQQMMKEEQQSTGKPDIMAPCVCNQPDNHSEYCREFKKKCVKSNTKLKIRRQTHSMTRSIDDLVAFGEIKHKRQTQRFQLQREEEDKELTFAPHISKRSTELHEQMKKKRKEDIQSIKRTDVTPAAADPNMFQPILSARSKQSLGNTKEKLGRNQSISESLFSVATEQQEQNFQKQHATIGNGLQDTNKLPESYRKVIHYYMSFRSQETPQFTILEYNSPTMEFIFEQFGVKSTN